MNRDIANELATVFKEAFKQGGRAWINPHTGQAGIEPPSALREDQRDFMNRNMPEFAALICGYVAHARACRMFSHYGVSSINADQIIANAGALEAMLTAFEKKHEAGEIAISEGLYYFFEYGFTQKDAGWLIGLGRQFAKDLIERMESERAAQQERVRAGVRKILSGKASLALRIDPYDAGLIEMLADLGQE